MLKPDIDKIPTFYKGYVELIPEDAKLLPLLIASRDEFIALLGKVPEKKGTFSYAKDKWSIKELVGHINDAERVFAYRSLRFGRADMTELQGFEQDDYVINSRVDERLLKDHIMEFTNTRNSTIDLYNGFTDKELSRFGSANGFRIDVNSLGFIIIGHLYHHMRILKDKYLIID